MKHFFKDNSINKKFIVFFMTIILVLNGLAGSQALIVSARADKTAPTAPTNLRATSISSNAITLAWNTSTDNVKVTSYEIYKNSTLVGTSTTTTYIASGLQPSTTYSFYVKAKDSAGNRSASSAILSVTTTATVTPTATPIPSPTPTTAPTATPVPTIAPTATPVPTVSPSATPIPTTTPSPVPSGKMVVGYYAAWSAYSNFTPDKVDASKLTHINYAFANIGSDLKIALGYPDVDPANFTKLNTLKQANPNLKTLISVGGWDWSGRFSDVALTDASRTAFADSCVAFILKYGFDGVDIDWEYPVSGGLSTNIRRAEDKTNFTLLIQKLREKLDAQGMLDGKHYLLSFAGASGSWYTNNVELSKLSQYVDYANIMTYDIHGNWDSYTDFNAPLYNNTDTSPQYKDSVDSGIKAWINAGYPASKLVMGVPFYGYIYKSVTNSNNGLYQTYSGASSISYANVAGNYLNAAGYVRYWHSQSMVPWLFNGSTFISYEDEQSMAYKASYIKTKGFAGAMIWELSQDPNRVLLNSLYNGLQ